MQFTEPSAVVDSGDGTEDMGKGNMVATPSENPDEYEGMSNDAPIHECQSEIDHDTGHYVPYSLQRVCRFFNVPQI